MAEHRIRRAAHGALALTAWSIPLSTTGMELGIGALGLLALLAWWKGMPVVRRTPLDGVLTIFFASLAVSTLASGRPWEASGWIRLWIVVGYFGVYWWLDSRDASVRMGRWLLFAGVVAGAYAIVQHYTGADWYRELLGRARMVKPRIAGAEGFAAVGFFRNYVTFAHVVIVPFGLALARAAETRKLSAAAAAIVLGVALVFSTARGAWAAALAMVVLLALRRRGPVILVAALVIGGTWLASPGLRQQVIPALTTSATNAGRLGIYAANLDIVHDHPWFGLGFGRYQARAAPYYDRHPEADRRSHAHNNFLQLAAEGGLVALAGFMLCIVTAIRYGAEGIARLRPSGGDAYATALGAWLAVIGSLVGGLTHYTLGDSEVAIAVWVALAILMRVRDT